MKIKIMGLHQERFLIKINNIFKVVLLKKSKIQTLLQNLTLNNNCNNNKIHNKMKAIIKT